MCVCVGVCDDLTVDGGLFAGSSVSVPRLQLPKVEGDHWWVGLHTYDNDGRFRWSDHSVLNYVSWGLSRPRPPSRDRKCVHTSVSKGERPSESPWQQTMNTCSGCPVRPSLHLSPVFLNLGEWADQKCHTDLPYICKRVNVTGTVPPTPSSPLPPMGCAEGWASFQHKVGL